MTTLAIHDPKFTITPTGIDFHAELSFDEWDDLGTKLTPVANSIRFIVGDWINYGEKRWGSKYKEALARTGLAYTTLSDYAYVARKVEFCLRKQNLDYCLHQAVAKLKTPEQKQHWLDMAEKHDLTVRRLRKSINFGRLATEEEVQGDPADRGYVTYLALLNRLRRWWKRETEKAPVDDWDEERREGLKRDFKFVADIYESL
jgi:hypothetical protein